jgi:hypothetical protein
VKVADWLESGLEPPIGSVQQWLVDHLGVAGAEEDACFALADGRTGVRILIATDIGLFDFRWQVDRHHLTGIHHRWSDVAGLRLTGETGVGPDRARRPPAWTLAIGEPELSVGPLDDAPAVTALLAFWRTCRVAMDGAG